MELFQSIKSIIYPGNIVEKEEVQGRYSLIFKLNKRYQHRYYHTECAALEAMSKLVTDNKRIPIGIYDSQTDQIKWELVVQYLMAHLPENESTKRAESIKGIIKSLRRRES